VGRRVIRAPTRNGSLVAQSGRLFIVVIGGCRVSSTIKTKEEHRKFSANFSGGSRTRSGESLFLKPVRKLTKAGFLGDKKKVN